MIRVLVFLLLAGPAAAQEMPLTPDSFLDRVAGRTITFRMQGSDELVGVERFIDRERSVWTRSDGSCALGDVTVREPELCFDYDDDPAVSHCWLPFEEGGDLFVRSTGTAEVQRIARIETRRLECAGEPMS